MLDYKVIKQAFNRSKSINYVKTMEEVISIEVIEMGHFIYDIIITEKNEFVGEHKTDISFIAYNKPEIYYITTSYVGVNFELVQCVMDFVKNLRYIK